MFVSHKDCIVNFAFDLLRFRQILPILKPLSLCSTSLYWHQILTQVLIRCCSMVQLPTDNAEGGIQPKT